LLSGVSVNSGRYYVVHAAYACAVTSRNNRRDVADGVLCGSAPNLYDLTRPTELSSASECSEVETVQWKS
jgi:hypothetical protein